MHLLYEHAIRYEWTDRNPITSVRQSRVRQATPIRLSVDQLSQLIYGELKQRPSHCGLLSQTVSAFRLIIQLSGVSRFYCTKRAPPQVESLLLTIVLLTLRHCKNRCPVGRDLGLERDEFKQAFSYEHENHYLQRPAP